MFTYLNRPQYIIKNNYEILHGRVKKKKKTLCFRFQVIRQTIKCIIMSAILSTIDDDLN